MFFARPPEALEDDLVLVVTSGSNDEPPLRGAALEWFFAWERVADPPWRVHPVTIDGGTHAAFSPMSYRIGVLDLFEPEANAR